MSFRPLLLGLFVLSLARGVHAQPGSNVAAAEVLFEEGRTAMAEGKYDLACARFRESDQLDPAVGTRLNLADCEEKRGNLAMAWSLFRAAASDLAPDDDRLPVAEQRMASLEVRVPRLTMVPGPGAPSGTRVNLDGAELATGSFGIALPLEPGMHRLVVRAPNRAERVYDVQLEEGDTKQLQIEPGPELPAEHDAEKSEVSTSNLQRTAGYVAVGVGALGFTVGTITGIMTLHKKSVADENCNDDLRLCNQEGKDANDAGRSLAGVSTAGFVIGLVGVGAGAALILTSPKPKAASVKTSLHVGAGFVSLTGKW